MKLNLSSSPAGRKVMTASQSPPRVSPTVSPRKERKERNKARRAKKDALKLKKDAKAAKKAAEAAMTENEIIAAHINSDNFLVSHATDSKTESTVTPENLLAQSRATYNHKYITMVWEQFFDHKLPIHLYTKFAADFNDLFASALWKGSEYGTDANASGAVTSWALHWANITASGTFKLNSAKMSYVITSPVEWFKAEVNGDKHFEFYNGGRYSYARGRDGSRKQSRDGKSQVSVSTDRGALEATSHKTVCDTQSTDEKSKNQKNKSKVVKYAPKVTAMGDAATAATKAAAANAAMVAATAAAEANYIVTTAADIVDDAVEVQYEETHNNLILKNMGGIVAVIDRPMSFPEFMAWLFKEFNCIVACFTIGDDGTLETREPITNLPISDSDGNAEVYVLFPYRTFKVTMWGCHSPVECRDWMIEEGHDELEHTKKDEDDVGWAHECKENGYVVITMTFNSPLGDGTDYVTEATTEFLQLQCDFHEFITKDSGYISYGDRNRPVGNVLPSFYHDYVRGAPVDCTNCWRSSSYCDGVGGGSNPCAEWADYETDEDTSSDVQPPQSDTDEDTNVTAATTRSGAMYRGRG